MNVLHVIPGLDPRTGGPAVALAGLAPALVRAGAEVSILSTWKTPEDPSIAEALRAQGLRVESIGPTAGPFSRHPQLAAIANQCVARADLVHIHALWEQVQHLAAGAARRLHKPYLIRPCGMLDPWSLGQSRWKKRLYMAWRLRRNLNHAAGLHFTTSIERDLTVPLRLKAPTIVEPNGVDLAEFENPPPPGTFRRQYPIAKGRPLVLFMSRLHHKKGLDKLIPAFSRMKNRDAILAIAGPDSDGYRAAVEKMIADAGIVDRVFFPGMLWREQRVAALADADLFVLPSYQENFGVAVVEALAAGTPVVISDQVNIHPEVRTAGVGGVVPMDVDRLTQELDRWIADDSLRREASVKAKAFARERYDWNQIARRWTGHYAEMTGKNFES